MDQDFEEMNDRTDKQLRMLKEMIKAKYDKASINRCYKSTSIDNLQLLTELLNSYRDPNAIVI